MAFLDELAFVVQPSTVVWPGANPHGFRHFGAPCPWLRSAIPSGHAQEDIVADDDMKAELERLRAENQRLKQRGSRAMSMKVSEKGALSVYGLGRFPVTLYKEQWGKLLDMADDIRAFIEENKDKLKTKGEE